MTVSDNEDDGDSVHSDHEHDAQHHDRSSSQEHSNGDDSDCTEVGNELMLAARKMRKDLRAQKRQAKEAKAKALKSKQAPIVSFYLKLFTQHPITGSQARELK